MKDSLHRLVEEYRFALQDYLDGAGEAALQHAYEIGRRAVTEGLGVLEMVAIHGEALGRVLLGTLKPEEKMRMAKAAEFSVESLSPFEMTHRAFREANAKLRLLSEHLQSVREEERTRIARDIHDELGQALTCLKMDLSWLDNRLLIDRSLRGPQSTHRKDQMRLPQYEQRRGRESKRQEPLVEKTKSMLKLIDKTIQTVRRISTELRPAVLDDLGLAAAIEWQAQEFQTRTKIKAKLMLPSQNLPLDQRRSTAIFRIFQETLTNVTRHSDATQVNIVLKKKGDDLILEVKDNGRGITECEISDAKSLGLLGMRERALLLGGAVHIKGTRRKGTKVTVRIPIRSTGGH